MNRTSIRNIRILIWSTADTTNPSHPSPISNICKKFKSSKKVVLDLLKASEEK